MSTPLLNHPSFAGATALAANNKTTRVLLVEDNQSDALLVRSALADLRDRKLYESFFDIRTAELLSTARARLAEEHFDVILLDLSLPDSQSPEHSFFHIREHACGIPIIVLTGVDDELLGSRMVRDGAQDYLIKSRVERYVLVKAIRYAIERQMANLIHRQLRLKLVTVQEEERHRIARELHDQLGQAIAALILGLKSLAHSYEPKNRDQADEQFQQLQNIANDLARNVHSLALDLRPTALDDLGLEVALSSYIEAWSSRWQISSHFHSNGFTKRRLAPHLETTIYRIVQDGLTNVVRHASARTVSLILERADDRVNAIIEDDGCGFDVKAAMKNAETEQKLGLLGMKERVALVGGSLSIESAPDRGTTLYVRIPISLQQNGEVAQWTN